MPFTRALLAQTDFWFIVELGPERLGLYDGLGSLEGICFMDEQPSPEALQAWLERAPSSWPTALKEALPQGMVRVNWF